MERKAVCKLGIFPLLKQLVFSPLLIGVNGREAGSGTAQRMKLSTSLYVRAQVIPPEVSGSSLTIYIWLPTARVPAPFSSKVAVMGFSAKAPELRILEQA